MVTPIHLFHTIKSGSFSSRHHVKSTPGCDSTVGHTPSTSNVCSSQPMVSTTLGTTTPGRDYGIIAKLKCGVWVFFICLAFMFVCSGMKGGGAFLLLLMVLIIGGLFSLYGPATATTSASRPQQIDIQPPPVPEQNDDDSQSSIGLRQPLQNQHSHTSQHQVPTIHHYQQLSPLAEESSPPPYDTVIMLPLQDDIATTGSVQVIRNSPPPSYEKTVIWK